MVVCESTAQYYSIYSWKKYWPTTKSHEDETEHYMMSKATYDAGIRIFSGELIWPREGPSRSF